MKFVVYQDISCITNILLKKYHLVQYAKISVKSGITAAFVITTSAKLVIKNKMLKKTQKQF